MQRQKEVHKIDRGFLILTIVLTIVGLLAVADASAPQAQAFFHDSFFFVKQQLIWALAGFIALFVTANIPYHYWKKIAIYAFGINVILLIAVLIPSVGSRLLGARRWISFGPIVFQPSELVKFTLATYMASLLSSKKRIFTYIIPLAVVASLIMLQPDLGTTIVVIVVGFVQLFIAGVPMLPFLGIGVGGGVVGAILILLSAYRKQRFLEFLKTTADPLGSSYHVRQVLIALGSGGLFGVGLGQSRQKNLFLPESATDSVFAVIAEEIGFVGATLVIALLVFYLYRAVKIAQRAPDEFGTLLASGIIAWIGAQMFLNIGSMVAVIPLTGVPLPFFSYGGSSLTMILGGVGILLNISKYSKSTIQLDSRRVKREKNMARRRHVHEQ
ncbi:MAG TPA: putative lipid II flippase FtsW [Patescibacteria group bacterium]